MSYPAVVHLGVDFPLNLNPEKKSVFSAREKRMKPEKTIYMSLLNPESDFWTNAVEVLKAKITDEDFEEYRKIALDKFARRTVVPNTGQFVPAPIARFFGQNISLSVSSHKRTGRPKGVKNSSTLRKEGK